MYDLIPFGRRADKLARSAFGDMSDVFDNFLNSFANPMTGNMMSSDMREKGDEFEIGIELPGVRKQDIQVNLDNGYLTVSVNTKEESQDEKENYIVRERKYGGCQRSFRLNGDIKKSDIKAEYKDGILVLTIPKAGEKKIKDTKVEVS